MKRHIFDICIVTRSKFENTKIGNGILGYYEFAQSLHKMSYKSYEVVKHRIVCHVVTELQRIEMI